MQIWKTPLCMGLDYSFEFLSWHSEIDYIISV
jgi:hypothetical protein